MAYNYQPMSQFPQGAAQNSFSATQNTFQQNVQPLFPQPQGNVYNINSTLEVANVPAGAGVSVALCLNEGLMYIKSMQNGNPLFWAYKIIPYDNSKPAEDKDSKEENATTNLEERIGALEENIQEIRKLIEKGEWKL